MGMTIYRGEIRLTGTVQDFLDTLVEKFKSFDGVESADGVESLVDTDLIRYLKYKDSEMYIRLTSDRDSTGSIKLNIVDGQNNVIGPSSYYFPINMHSGTASYSESVLRYNAYSFFISDDCFLYGFSGPSTTAPSMRAVGGYIKVENLQADTVYMVFPPSNSGADQYISGTLYDKDNQTYIKTINWSDGLKDQSGERLLAASKILWYQYNSGPKFYTPQKFLLTLAKYGTATIYEGQICLLDDERYYVLSNILSSSSSVERWLYPLDEIIYEE